MVPSPSRATSAPVKTASTPGAPARRVAVDRADAGVRVGRAHQHRVHLVGQVHVGVEAPLAAQQAHVLEALDGLPDAELTHDRGAYHKFLLRRPEAPF